MTIARKDVSHNSFDHSPILPDVVPMLSRCYANFYFGKRRGNLIINIHKILETTTIKSLPTGVEDKCRKIADEAFFRAYFALPRVSVEIRTRTLKIIIIIISRLARSIQSEFESQQAGALVEGVMHSVWN